MLQVSIYNPKQKINGDFALQTNLTFPDDNVDKLCEVFRVFPNGEKDVNISMVKLIWEMGNYIPKRGGGHVYNVYLAYKNDEQIKKKIINR